MAVLGVSQMPALQVQAPDLRIAENYEAGVNARINQTTAQMQQQAMQVEMLASGAAYAMPNGPNGDVDPVKWNEVLDSYEESGMPPDKVAAFRDRPELAKVLLHSSASALAAANDQQMFPLKLKEMEAQIAQTIANTEAGASGTQETWGLTPQAYEMQDGTIKIGVLSNLGNFKEVGLPEGASPAFPVQQVNTGTGFTEMNKFGGTTGNVTPIDNVGKARDTEIGKIVGSNVANAPKSIETADRTLTAIDNILNDPALPQAVGIGGILPAIPGTDQAGVIAKIDQLKGQAFLEAFNTLKGGGQITEVEGKKATDAIARLDRAQNLEDFTTALNELRSIVEAAKARAEQQSNGGPSSVGAAGGEDADLSNVPDGAIDAKVVDGKTYFTMDGEDWYPADAE